MDLQAIQQRAMAAREFEHSIGEITYRLRVPTRHEVLLAAQRCGALRVNGDAAAMLVLQRAVLEGALIGWTGARVRHVLPPEHAGADAEAPLPWAAEAVPLLLDALPDDAQALAGEITQRTERRAAAIEADRKN